MTSHLTPEPQGDRPAAARGRGEPAVLVVDDERSLLAVVSRILARAGYQVEQATTPAEALALCADGGVPLDVMLTDAVMPAMSGGELAREATRLRPDLEVIFMSGYGDDAGARHGPHEAGAWLEKPFGPEELVGCIAANLGRRRISKSPN